MASTKTSQKIDTNTITIKSVTTRDVPTSLTRDSTIICWVLFLRNRDLLYLLVLRMRHKHICIGKTVTLALLVKFLFKSKKRNFCTPRVTLIRSGCATTTLFAVGLFAFHVSGEQTARITGKFLALGIISGAIHHRTGPRCPEAKREQKVPGAVS